MGDEPEVDENVAQSGVVKLMNEIIYLREILDADVITDAEIEQRFWEELYFKDEELHLQLNPLTHDELWALRDGMSEELLAFGFGKLVARKLRELLTEELRALDADVS